MPLRGPGIGLENGRRVEGVSRSKCGCAGPRPMRVCVCLCAVYGNFSNTVSGLLPRLFRHVHVGFPLRIFCQMKIPIVVKWRWRRGQEKVNEAFGREGGKLGGGLSFAAGA